MDIIKSFPLTYQELILSIGLSSITYSIADGSSDKIWITIITPIVSFIVLIIFIAIYKIWNTSKNRFKFVKSKKNSKFHKKILDAKLSIVVTHFSKNNPKDGYTESLIENMENDVSVTRVVSNSINKNDQSNEWLSAFQGKKNYFQKNTQLNFMPFDIYIIDHKIVLLSFPSTMDQTNFTEGVLFENEELARLFEISIDKIINYRKENLESTMEEEKKINAKDKHLTNKKIFAKLTNQVENLPEEQFSKLMDIINQRNNPENK